MSLNNSSRHNQIKPQGVESLLNACTANLDQRQIYYSESSVGIEITLSPSSHINLPIAVRKGTTNTPNMPYLILYI